MATSFKTYADRENIGSSVLKPSVSNVGQGQKGLSAKTTVGPTPRKVLGDVGNLQQGTSKKFQTPKPPKVKIFEETPKAKSSVKSNKGTFSVLNAQKMKKKVLSDGKAKVKHDNFLSEVENMTPFTDQENDIPVSSNITKLLRHRGLLNHFALLTPTTYNNNDEATDDPDASKYEFDEVEAPYFDETIADIIGYDEPPEFATPHLGLHYLPPLEDIPLDIPLTS